MIDLVTKNAVRIAELCRKHGVRRLEIFGSAVRGDFDAARSDLDFMVEFEPAPRQGLRDRYFLLWSDLEALFGRSIDLIEVGAVSNPVIAASIDREKVPVYAAA